MKQLTQELKAGKMEILEVPFPLLSKGQVLVRNYYSVISAGTESKTVSDARKGYIAKAKSRKKEVKMVIDSIKQNGFKDTYNIVMNKLNAPSSLGYSCAGEVIAVGNEISDIKVGDFVACGGDNAVHAEVVSVPYNLCVKIPNRELVRSSSLATIGAIGIQGIRQSQLSFGCNCVVIGLGLIGQLTGLMLDAIGIKPICIDLDADKVEFAKKLGLKYCYTRNQDGIEDIIRKINRGHGADAVIITAGTSSLDPVDFAGEIARKKANVVIVGAVPTGFSRKNYYRKELNLIMSTSYGPGRYDSDYELKGIDYPISHVRFTENRNMQTFIDLLAENQLNVDGIFTHEYMLEKANEAYDLILKNDELYSGILIQYENDTSVQKTVRIQEKSQSSQKPSIGLIGAGSFAQNIILPELNKITNPYAIATNKGNDSVFVAKKYGFAKCYNSADEIFKDDQVNTIFITTRHDSHADLVGKAISNNKHVYVEKPLAISFQELNELKEQYIGGTKRINLLVGFNRRYSPLIKELMSNMDSTQPKTILYRVNAGKVPAEHWVHDPEFGGGRINGEVCHFIDLATYIAQSKLLNLTASVLNDGKDLDDSLVINLKFENGSIASIIYTSNGNSKLPKEYIEVFSTGSVYKIDDFKTMRYYGNKVQNRKLKKQNKGHAEILKSYIDDISNAKSETIPFAEIYNSTLATLYVLKSINENRLVHLETQL